MKSLKKYLFIGAFIPLPLLIFLIFLTTQVDYDLIGFSSKESFVMTVFVVLGLPLLALIFKDKIDPFNHKNDQS